MDISGVILCGGHGLRMGGVEKGLMLLNGQALVSHVANKLTSCPQIFINCNQQLADYEALGFAVFEDQLHADIGTNAGPLLGIYSALVHAPTDWIIVSPCDTPNIPDDYVRKMAKMASKKMSYACAAHDGERRQNLHVLLHKSLTENLLMYLLSGRRKTWQWLDSIKAVDVPFKNPEQFINVNTQTELDALQHITVE